MWNDWYLSPVMLACYEGEGEGGEGGTDGAGADAGGAGGEGGDNKGKVANAERTFTQAQVNSYVAEDRRKTEAKFKAQLKAELERQEKMYNELLTNKNLTEQERDGLREALANVEKELHSREELLKREKKLAEERLTGKVTEAEKRAQDWETRFRESHINRQLQDAAATNDAYNSRQIVSLLRPKTQMVPVPDSAGKETGEYQVLVDLDDVVDGKPTVTRLAPDAAVKRMKELSEYGNLFKSNVVSGVGSNSTTGASSGTTGTIDLKNMTQAQYREWRKTQPALVGSRGVRR